MEEKTSIEFKHFFCRECSYYWQSNDYTSKDKAFYSKCPNCNKSVQNVPHCYANLPKMWDNATGPRTKEGKERSSMNNYKHGMFTKNLSLLAPTLHDKYVYCKGCEYYQDCKDKKLKYCPTNLEPMLKFLAAYKEGRVSELKEIAALSQGKVQLVLEQMLYKIFDEGVVVTSKHNNFEELKANPCLKYISDFMSILGFTSDQQKMNPKESDTDGKDPKGNLEGLEGAGNFILNLTAKFREQAEKIKALSSPESDDPLNTDKEIEEKELETGPEKNPFPK